MQDMTMRNREGASGKQQRRMLKSSSQSVAVASVELQRASEAGDPSLDLPQDARSKQVSSRVESPKPGANQFGAQAYRA